MKKNVNNDHFILIWFGDSVFLTIILHENNSSWSIYWYGAMFFFRSRYVSRNSFFQRYNLILHIDLHVFYKIPVRYKEHTESAFLCANLAYFTLQFCNYEIEVSVLSLFKLTTWIDEWCMWVCVVVRCIFFFGERETKCIKWKFILSDMFWIETFDR